MKSRENLAECGRWTWQEHERYLLAIADKNNDTWKKVAGVVGTRSATQCRTHHQKVKLKAAKPTPLPKESKGVQCSEIQDQGWGRLVSLTLPGGGDLGVYEARHASPIDGVGP